MKAEQREAKLHELEDVRAGRAVRRKLAEYDAADRAGKVAWLNDRISALTAARNKLEKEQRGEREGDSHE